MILKGRRKKYLIVYKTDRKISDKEYELILNVWKKFERETMKDYQDLYSKCNVLLLAGVFENFRNSSNSMIGMQCLI